MKKFKQWFSLFCFISIICFGFPVFAIDDLPPAVQFQNGQTADADQVNDNFNNAYNKINELIQQISVLEQQIADFSAVSLSDDLVAHYTFDYDHNLAHDSSSRYHSGTNYGAIQVTGTAAKVGSGALGLDGNDYLYIQKHHDFDFYADDFSFSFWINTVQSARAMVYSRAGGGNYASGDIILESNGGTFSVSLTTTTGERHGSNGLTTTGFNDGNWHHISIVRSGTAMTLYIDGVQVSTLDLTSYNELKTVGYAIAIGRYSVNDSSAYFDGFLDDYRIYRRALSLAEICQLMSLGGETCSP